MAVDITATLNLVGNGPLSVNTVLFRIVLSRLLRTII